MSKTSQCVNAPNWTYGHCWHAVAFPHAVYVHDGRHEDLVCCNCGTKVCEDVFEPPLTPHGPYLPGRPRLEILER